MKQRSTFRPRRVFQAAFTLVELLVVIVVIAILATITIIGFGAWRTRAATTEVKADAAGVQSGMEEARNRLNGYPVFAAGTEYNGSANGTKNIFIESKNVQVIYASGDGNSYCVNITSKAVPSVQMFLNTSGGNTLAQNGTC